MRLVRQGELEKLGLLFERHHRALFNFFSRLTGHRGLSEDLVQEVFLRILKYRDSFKAEHGFATWMYQIARNVNFDQMRKRTRETGLLADFEEAGGPASEAPSPERAAK